MKIRFILIFPVLIWALSTGCNYENSDNKSPVDYVDPMIGTGFHGHTYPGAVVPFGRVQLSPDTRLEGWDASSGYHYSDSTIYGFSHTHLSGTGIGDMGDILFLPYTGDLIEKPIATFSHDDESASAGYYSVILQPWNVFCELSATLRTGWHRYTYPEGSDGNLFIDLGHVLQTTWGNRLIESSLRVIDKNTIEGYRLTSGWAAHDPVYFRAEFSHEFEVINLTVDSQNSSGSVFAEGRDIKAHISFKKPDKPVEIRVSISAVDYEGARVNMDEVASFDSFDQIRDEARLKWSETLSSIEIESDDESVLANFYTAMYHSHLAPMVFSDADGRYIGMNREIHTITSGNAYTVFSLWDTFRAWFPLMTIINPEKSGEWVYSLLDAYKQGGLLPKWPLVGNYTGTMVGYPALSLFADAMTKGLADSVPGELIEAAVTSASWQPELYEKVRRTRAVNVMPGHIMFKESIGFVPVDECVESVSWGLEMAYYDWCLAQMARYTGDKDLASLWEDKSKYYINYFDHSTGFMRARTLDGKWYADFNPNYSSHEKSEYTEGNAWQWTPFVPHDINGLQELMGGRRAMGEWLDTLFTTASIIEGEHASGDITGLIGQYAHGNEPSHHVAYLYNYTDRPWRTAEIVDSILYHFYLPTPEGIIGNEDCGQMSAWYILSALGFYQIAPGNPVYDLGRPIVESARIRQGNGWFNIKVHNNSRENKYIAKVVLNGNELGGLQLNHSDIRAGGQLEFYMASEPARY
jgi:predicted alpha-1,2-mannosidase